MFYKPFYTLIFYIVLIATAAFPQSQKITEYSYAVVISTAAYADAEWKRVADTLMVIHGRGHNRVQLFQWSSSVSGISSDLVAFEPDYIGYIARPASECNSSFVRAVKDLACNLDDDPYADAVWGVITGYNAADAVRAVTSPLRARTRISGDELKSPWMPEHFMFNPDQPSVEVRFADGSVYTSSSLTGSDRIVPICDFLNNGITVDVPNYPGIDGTVDVFITGGHGNVNTWQAHYPDVGSEGFLVSNNGQLSGDPAVGSSIAINKKTPTVYYAINNCLVGNPDNINNMVYAWFHTGYAVNMFGYLESTSCSEVFYRGVLRFSKYLTPGEAYFLGFNTVIHDLENSDYFLANESGLIFNRDQGAVYGDPKADVYVEDDPYNDAQKPFRDTLIHSATPQNVPDTFEVRSTVVGDQFTAWEWDIRPWRPAFFLPVKIEPASIRIEQDQSHFSTITDNFVIFDAWRPDDRSGSYVPRGTEKVLRWTAQTKPQITPIAQGTFGSSAKTHCTMLAQSLHGRIMVRVSGMPQAPATVCLYTAAGQCVARRRITHADAKRNIDITGNTSRPCGSGIYYVTLKAGNHLLKQQVMHLAHAGISR